MPPQECRRFSAELKSNEDDIAITKNLNDGGTLLRIPVLDHVLFSRTEYMSFKERGLMD